MKLSTWISGLTITALCMGCSSVEQADQNSAQTTHRDTVLIDADRLEQGRLFEPARNPFTRDDAAQLVGADSVSYKTDTLATTENAYLVLVGRLYANETIGWLMTIDRTNRQLIDHQVVYYDNAEGISQIEGMWLPRQQQAIVQTITYDETGTEQAKRVTYTVQPDGELTLLN